MAQPEFLALPHAELLRAVFDLPGRGLDRSMAERFLEMDFPPDAAQRAEELNGKANEGTLTPEEASELEAYANVADLLAWWQSRARQTLHMPK